MAKIFCGGGKTQGDRWIKATINVAKIKDHIQEYKGTKFVKIDINIKDEPDRYGKDVSITIDEWQPTKEEDQVEVKPDTNNDDLPF